MAKNKKRRKNKKSILPMLAIGAGIYLLTRRPKEVVIIPPTKTPSLPSGNSQSLPQVQRLKRPVLSTTF